MTMKRSAYFSIPAQVGLRLQTAMCLAALTAVSGGALAADEDANATADAAQLQTVTVTARYQQEDLQKTPIAISTTSAEQLKSANVASIDTIGQLVPNLYTYPPDADEGGVPTIVMRGVG